MKMISDMWDFCNHKNSKINMDRKYQQTTVGQKPVSNTNLAWFGEPSFLRELYFLFPKVPS